MIHNLFVICGADHVSVFRTLCDGQTYWFMQTTRKVNTYTQMVCWSLKENTGFFFIEFLLFIPKFHGNTKANDAFVHLSIFYGLSCLKKKKMKAIAHPEAAGHWHYQQTLLKQKWMVHSGRCAGKNLWQRDTCVWNQFKMNCSVQVQHNEANVSLSIRVLFAVVGQQRRDGTDEYATFGFGWHFFYLELHSVELTTPPRLIDPPKWFISRKTLLKKVKNRSWICIHIQV